MIGVLRSAALLLTATALAPALAHVLELPAKMGLPREAYLQVQQLYRGWALFGIPIMLDLVVIATLAWRLRNTLGPFRWTIAALVCLLGAQAVFWTWTFPANAATRQWTMLPDGWEALRRQWEFSHAAGAALTFGAFACLVGSTHAMARDGRSH